MQVRSLVQLEYCIVFKKCIYMQPKLNIFDLVKPGPGRCFAHRLMHYLTILGGSDLRRDASFTDCYFFIDFTITTRLFPHTFLTNLVTDTRQDATGLQLRNAHLLSLPPIRLTSFRNSYIPATTRQWNLLPETLRNTPSRRDFSRQVWQRFGAPDPPTLNTVGTKTLNTQHTRLRVGLTTLNAHLFQFQLTPSPSCSCGHKFEDTAHYILRCPK